MAFARNSLDIIICSHHPDQPLDWDAMQRLLICWQERGWLDDDGHPIARDQLISGGFARLLLEKPEKVLLYANHQGGYRVSCPEKGENVALAFSRAVHRWRKGDNREMECPVCDSIHPLEEVRLQPKGAFSQGALLFRGVESIQLSEVAWRDIEECLGRTVMVFRRLA